MRIRPIDIEVPEGDPFANDRLDRRDQIQAIAAILAKVEGPFVLAVDAPWGEGKTTFLRIGQAYLRKQGSLVVDFNAWETDFCDDPFIALTTEVIQGLETFSTEDAGDEIAEALKPLRKRSRSFISWRTVSMGAKFLVQLKTGIDASSLIDVLSQEDEKLAESKIKSYEAQKRLMHSFTEALTKVGALTKGATGRPLVIFIDELDRCRPTYAIELLETIKHLFSVDNVVFILGINRQQLSHSVRAVYGEQFGAEKYLSRLIDIDLDLPRPDIAKFITSIVEACGIARSQSTSTTSEARFGSTDINRIFGQLLGSSGLSLRDIAQLIHHLGLVLASLPPNYYRLFPLTVILLVLRSIDRALYDRFIKGAATDAEVVDSLFGRPGLKARVSADKRSYMEAFIINAYREIIDIGDSVFDNSTPLLTNYGNLIDSPGDATPEKDYAKEVVERAHRLMPPDGRWYPRIVVARIEMFAETYVQ